MRSIVPTPADGFVSSSRRAYCPRSSKFTTSPGCCPLLEGLAAGGGQVCRDKHISERDEALGTAQVTP